MEEEKQEYGIVVNSTKLQLKRFKESVIWADITRELSMWIEGFEFEKSSIVDNAATENPSTASVLIHIGDLNGRKKAVLYMLGILDVFLDTKETEDDSKRE